MEVSYSSNAPLILLQRFWFKDNHISNFKDGRILLQPLVGNAQSIEVIGLPLTPELSKYALPMQPHLADGHPRKRGCSWSPERVLFSAVHEQIWGDQRALKILSRNSQRSVVDAGLQLNDQSLHLSKGE